MVCLGSENACDIQSIQTQETIDQSNEPYRHSKQLINQMNHTNTANN